MAAVPTTLGLKKKKKKESETEQCKGMELNQSPLGRMIVKREDDSSSMCSGLSAHIWCKHVYFRFNAYLYVSVDSTDLSFSFWEYELPR